MRWNFSKNKRESRREITSMQISSWNRYNIYRTFNVSGEHWPTVLFMLHCLWITASIRNAYVSRPKVEFISRPFLLFSIICILPLESGRMWEISVSVGKILNRFQTFPNILSPLVDRSLKIDQKLARSEPQQSLHAQKRIKIKKISNRCTSDDNDFRATNQRRLEASNFPL